MSKIKLAWHNWGRWLCLAAAGMLALGFLALYLVVWIKSGEEDDAVPSDCIVVLGAKARGMDAVHLSQAYGKDLVFVGGVDTQELLPFGTPRQVRDEVRRLRDLFGPNYVVSPSHESILPGVTIENVLAMAEAAAE